MFGDLLEKQDHIAFVKHRAGKGFPITLNILQRASPITLVSFLKSFLSRESFSSVANWYFSPREALKNIISSAYWNIWKALFPAETYNDIVDNAPSGSKIFRRIGGGSALHKTLS